METKELKGFRKIVEKITSEKVLEIYIIAAMVSIPLFALSTDAVGRPFITQPYVVSAIGVVGIVLGICSIMKRKDNLYFTDYLFLLLILFASLSLAFSKDIGESLYGFVYEEFIVHFFAYFSLMLAATMINDEVRRKRILKFFVGVIVSHSLVAVFQTMDICLSPSFWYSGGDSVWGLTQNSNWYGGISTLFCACSAGLFLFADNRRRRNMYLCINMVSFYTLLSSDARSAWVGTISYVIFYAISIVIAKEKKLWKRYAILLFSMVAVILFAIFVCGRIVDRVQSTTRELQSTNIDNLGSKRVYLWRYALESVPDNWMFGVGLDNLKYAFTSNPRYKPGDWYNAKAHNEYIHYLATQGVFQFITYMTLLVYAVVRAVKTVLHTEDKSNKYITWIFLGMFAAYSAQAMFNSSVINIAPYFWITIGMCVPLKNQNKKSKKKSNAIDVNMEN